MQLLLALGLLVIMAGIGWTALGRAGVVAPLHWHPQAAWVALRKGTRALSTPHPRLASPGRSPTGSPPASVSSSIAHPALAPVHGLLMLALLLLGAVLLVWILWGTVTWLYNTPSSVRRFTLWIDWVLWRWPVVTAGHLTGHPAWGLDAWARHKRRWQSSPSVTGPDATLTQAATVLALGFETSHAADQNLLWETLPDGAMIRRMLLIVESGSIRPRWQTGFHTATMQAWVQWATQWAEVALHHAGISGHWAVNGEGMIRPGSDRASASAPSTASLASPKSNPSSDASGLAPTIRWGSHGLPWTDLMPIAPQPLPTLAEPLPMSRAREVAHVLETLGIPDTEALGGQRGLAVDVVELRPTPALANRLLTSAMATTLAGQLGHGETPLRVHYVDQKPGILAVERPRPNRQFVDVVTALARTTSKDRQALMTMALPVCVGVTPDGRIIWSDAAMWPHLLVGGTTGGGKTTALVAWLASLMLTTPPDDLRLTLVDPKAGSQFPWATQVPHVDALLTTPQEVCALVAQWADEQEARYAAFRDAGVVDVYAARQAGLASYPFRLLVVDEYKDLKDQLDKDDLKELERNIGRIGQKARGAGLFIWIATQHPLAETISSTLKNNLPTRLALRVTSASASQVVLDEPGADTLLGKGDAFFKPGDASTLIRVQTPQASDRIWEVIRHGWQPTSQDAAMS